MSLLNPSDLFLVCLSIVSKDALIASIGAEELTNSFDIRFAYANWVFFLTFGLWVVISLGAAVLLFKKKEDI
jgi:LPXTG-motif cell wall-anchored protein